MNNLFKIAINLSDTFVAIDGSVTVFCSKSRLDGKEVVLLAINQYTLFPSNDVVTSKIETHKSYVAEPSVQETMQQPFQPALLGLIDAES